MNICRSALLFLLFAAAVSPLSAQVQPLAARPDVPGVIQCGPFRGTGHTQGIAVDMRHRVIYFSMTTMLVKCDFEGRVLGSVGGLLGHLGCLDFNEADGRVYGTLEYKDDAIGRGVLRTVGCDTTIQNGFYVASFDGERITREGMDGRGDGVMRLINLPTVLADYSARVCVAGDTLPHRYACSGMDGLAFGPRFGRTDGRQYLTVAYGVYGDTTRMDNDYQVLLQYRLRGDEAVLEKPAGRYFVRTGNTDWGVQNLEYDATSGLWLMAVYRGHKPQFPNYKMFAVSAASRPCRQPLQGVPYHKGKALVLPLAPAGLRDARTGVRGWNFPLGSNGIHAFGGGWYYFVDTRYTAGRASAIIRLYHSVSTREGFVADE